ncbi:unnamed protein product [Linum tenue]|uniref:Uncharacterized protein n=1 Tax=Linum tenue TaxID=586396 RepID=A0AAV0Q9N8_9ROSI|nr:unnamed protein product [Linum tenue]
MAKTQSLLIAFVWVLAVASMIMSAAAIRPATISGSNVQPQFHHWGYHHGHHGDHHRKL